MSALPVLWTPGSVDSGSRMIAGDQVQEHNRPKWRRSCNHCCARSFEAYKNLNSSRKHVAITAHEFPGKRVEIYAGETPMRVSCECLPLLQCCSVPRVAHLPTVQLQRCGMPGSGLLQSGTKSLKPSHLAEFKSRVKVHRQGWMELSVVSTSKRFRGRKVMHASLQFTVSASGMPILQIGVPVTWQRP